MLYRGKVFLEVERPDKSLMEQLKPFSVATLHEAMMRNGLMLSCIRPLIPGIKLIGPAVTAWNHNGDNISMHKALALAKPGDVLVTTMYAGDGGAMWGEMVTISAMARGIAGVIVDGSVRDTSIIKKLGFPVWYKSISSLGTVKETLGSVNTPVVCGGIAVEPGDVVVADDDGVVVIPKGSIKEVIEHADARETYEKSLKLRLAAGELFTEIAKLDELLRKKGMEEIPGPFRR